jgi:hypothetical protein
MAFAADYAVLYDRLDEELRFAPRPTPDLFAKIVGGACSRIAVLNKSEKAAQIDRLIKSNAWTDAALALLELELPAWKLRRLVYESGEWICSLTLRPNMPPTLDDTIDASHELMPLAILSAFVQARRSTDGTRQLVPAVPTVQSAMDQPVCCDNFA